MSILSRLIASIKPYIAAFMSIETAHAIVRDYASFIATSTPQPGCVADAQRLPHPKQQIKKAISVCLQSSDDTKLNEELAYGFLLLSAWQEGVGNQTLGFDVTKIKLDQDPLLVAENIQRHSETMYQWKPLIAAEQRVLCLELEALKNQTELSFSPQKTDLLH